jgi:hypothetical protein
MKLKGCHFDTIEMNKGESQALLNILTGCITKWQKGWECCIRTKGDGGW